MSGNMRRKIIATFLEVSIGLVAITGCGGADAKSKSTSKETIGESARYCGLNSFYNLKK